MSLGHGTSNVRDGLIFLYDFNNKKSWKGKPVTNYYESISTSLSLRTRTQHYWDGNRWSTTSPYTHPGVPGPRGVFLGLVYKHTSGALSSSWSGNSYGYTHKNITTVDGNNYVMSTWIYVSQDCDVSTMRLTTESGTTNNITIDGYNRDYNLTQKGTWQQCAVGVVADDDTRFLPVYPSKEGVTDGSFVGFYMWGGVQVEDGLSVSEYAAEPTYAREASQSLIELTGNNTLTINNMSYGESIYFNGTDDSVSTDLDLSWDDTNSVTIEMLIKPANLSLYAPFIGKTEYEWQLMQSNKSLVFYYWNNVGGHTNGSIQTIPNYFNSVNEYVYLSMVWNNIDNNYYFYRNGQLVHTGEWIDASINANKSDTVKVGGNIYKGASPNNYWNGEINILRIYNRALTSIEVLHNYNSIRGRFEI